MKCFHRGMLCSYKFIGFSLISSVFSSLLILLCCSHLKGECKNVPHDIYAISHMNSSRYKKNSLKFTSPVSGEISVLNISIYHMYHTWNLPATVTNIEVKFLSKTCQVWSILSTAHCFLLSGAQTPCPSSLFVSLFMLWDYVDGGIRDIFSFCKVCIKSSLGSFNHLVIRINFFPIVDLLRMIFD